MLEIQNVSKQYPRPNQQQVDAVSGVSLTLEEHRIYALVGESGCGKSTLSRLILGLEAPTSGRVLLDGAPVSRKGKAGRIQTVYQAIAEPIRTVLQLPKEEERQRVFALIARMGLPEESAEQKTGELSGGQQKRVGIARALALSPRYIVFDESLSGLDVILRKKILKLLKRVQENERCSYLFITHEIDAALYLADEIHVMQNGKLVESCRWEGNLDAFQHPYTKRLLKASHLLYPRDTRPSGRDLYKRIQERKVTL